MKDQTWIIFSDGEVLLQHQSSGYVLPLTEHIAAIRSTLTLVEQNGTGSPTGEQPKIAFLSNKKAISTLSSHFEWISVRQAFFLLPQVQFFEICKAKCQAEWYLNNQFCGRCGKKTALHHKENAFECLSCKKLYYPKYSPCVLCLVYHPENKSIVLAQSHHFVGNHYSVIAGFIEPGESAEQAAVREVKEEVGLEVSELEYMGSQHWPFPDNFMLGFTAQFISGELKIDQEELKDAKWFDLNHLPDLPKRPSLSRHLIDDFIQKNKVD